LKNGERSARFERLMLPHLDAAYNLARWLTGNDADAEDAVQEAYLRALRFFDGFRGDGAKPWLLAIVRNACFSLGEQRRIAALSDPFDETVHSAGEPGGGASRIGIDPERAAIGRAERERIGRAIETLPVAFREVLVLRELEDLSYGDIARVVDVPLGTVMSRLARARQMLRTALVEPVRKLRLR
jgi:RNA polymerase sigma factor (sigma-70 family)